jgi:hypothetical protein
MNVYLWKYSDFTGRDRLYGSRIWAADCWLEVGGHREGSEAGQLHQGVMRFSLVLEEILSFYPNSALHCVLLTRHPLPHKKIPSKFSSRSSNITINIFQNAALQIQNSTFNPQFCLPCCMLSTHPIVSLSSLPSPLPYLQPAFPKWTSGKCQGIFQNHRFFSSPPLQ